MASQQEVLDNSRRGKQAKQKTQQDGTEPQSQID